MTVLSRKTVKEEIGNGLSTALVGSGKPASALYTYQKGKLGGESPVILVVSGILERMFRGMGAVTYDSNFLIECHVLVYDGDNNQPLTETLREDKGDELEAAIATWVAANQKGTCYRALRYSKPTERASVIMLDGEPYLLEIISLEVEATD